MRGVFLLLLISSALSGCSSLNPEGMLVNAKRHGVTVKIISINVPLGPADEKGDGLQYNSEVIHQFGDDGRLQGADIE
jgi:hypothetical protein